MDERQMNAIPGELRSAQTSGNLQRADQANRVQDGCGQAMSQRPSRLEQLMKQQHYNESNTRMRERAINILSRHPEFEEFLELQELLRNSQLF